MWGFFFTGDTVTDVLKYVSYDRDDLISSVRRFTEIALTRFQATRGLVADGIAGPKTAVALGLR